MEAGRVAAFWNMPERAIRPGVKSCSAAQGGSPAKSLRGPGLLNKGVASRVRQLTLDLEGLREGSCRRLPYLRRGEVLGEVRSLTVSIFTTSPSEN